METKAIQQIVQLRAAPHEVYETLMDSVLYAAFTGREAHISSEVSGMYTCYGGLLSWRNLELVLGRQIVQTWQIAIEGWTPGHNSKVTLELFLANEGGSGANTEGCR